jgi:hypothetical protein
MILQAAVVVVLSLPFFWTSYTLGVENGSSAAVDDVKMICEEIDVSRSLGYLSVGIHKRMILRNRVPQQVTVQWRREDQRFSVTVPIPPDVRKRVTSRTRLFIRILGDGRAAPYVEIINPLHLAERTYYPPEFAPPRDNE